MREHLCLKVKVLERTIRTSNSRIGFSDMLRNTDNKGVWKFGQTLWEQACTDVLRLDDLISLLLSRLQWWPIQMLC